MNRRVMVGRLGWIVGPEDRWRPLTAASLALTIEILGPMVVSMAGPTDRPSEVLWSVDGGPDRVN